MGEIWVATKALIVYRKRVLIINAQIIVESAKMNGNLLEAV